MFLLHNNERITFDEIDLTGIKGMLVDFDNTLYEYEPCHKKGLRSAYEKVNEWHPISFEDFIVAYKKAQKVVKERVGLVAASHSRILYFQTLLEEFFGKTMIEESLVLESVYWDSFYETIQYQEEALTFLKNAQNNTIKICLVTDLTTTVQFRKMVASRLISYVDYVVTSEEAGKEKPDKAVFSLALDKLCMKADEVIMIGDDGIKDIQGAIQQGIRAYQVVHP